MSTTSEANTPEQTVFQPERTHLLSLVVMTLILIVTVGSAPKLFAWFLIIPVLFLAWILRAKTVVSEEGITANYVFGAPKSARWEEIQGVSFPSSKAVLQKKDGSSFKLPAITFNSLPKLEAASAGRIPDALSAGLSAASEKVVIVSRDGKQVMLSQEEYREYLKEHPDLASMQTEDKADRPGTGRNDPRP